MPDWFWMHIPEADVGYPHSFYKAWHVRPGGLNGMIEDVCVVGVYYSL